MLDLKTGEVYVSLSGEEKPQRFTSYPMLVRGSTRPAGFVPPSKAVAGGGLAELIPDELVNSGAGCGMELEKLGPRKWRFHGTPTSSWPVAGAPVHRPRPLIAKPPLASRGRGCFSLAIGLNRAPPLPSGGGGGFLRFTRLSARSIWGVN